MKGRSLPGKYLEIKRSRIPGAGKGLFTCVFIARDTLITEYKGKVSSWNDANHDDGKNAYLYYVNKDHVIDAKDSKALARFANDGKGPGASAIIKNNARYILLENRVFIKSIRDIPAGSEILVGYGKKYWDVLKKNKVL